MKNELRALQERIAELQEQNASLRESSVTFAQLAERLNECLRQERASARGRKAPRSHVPAERATSREASFV